MVAVVADGAAIFGDGTEIVGGCVRVVYWCTLSERGRRHCDQESSDLWLCDVVERGGCDWGGGCEDAGEVREWELCHLERSWWSQE